MRERKYIKFRVDMYDDTKFKIIDRNPKRDLINYVWTRVVVLAGKINLEGELYLSKTIPYTIETLAIEFNRDADQIKSAFDVLMELEMIELTKDKIYIVKNFAKHQNIKVKEKNKLEDKDKNIINKEDEVKENADTVMHVSASKESEEKAIQNKLENEKGSKVENIKSEDVANIEVINEYENIMTDNMDNNELNNSLGNSVTINLDTKRNNKINKKEKTDDISEIMEESEEEQAVCCIIDGEYILGPDERILKEWSFS